MTLSRRQVLGGLASAVGGLATVARGAGSGSWASPPNATAAGLLLPAGVRAEKVLDVFLYGGLSPYETFYLVPGYGAPDAQKYPNEQSWLFRQALEAARARCGGSDLPFSEPFAKDSLGVDVHFGPLVAPLRRRPDVLARTRVLVMHHTLEPHEAAIPYALTGFRLGNSRLAGMGASVQRYFLDRDQTGRQIPFSWALYPDNIISTDNVGAASAIGLHSGAARPIDLRVTPESQLARQLTREALGDRREAWDALVRWHAEQANARYALRGEAVRSRHLDDHDFAIRTLTESETLRDVLGGADFAPIESTVCETYGVNLTEMSLQLAVELLTHPDTPARHVSVVDGGLVPASGGGGYDVHTEHIESTALNLTNVLQGLLDRVNEPGEGDPRKIDLDDTMIVLNTEFGRTPFLQAGSGNGTNHHPYGYVTVLIGGPVGPEQRGVLGALGPDAWGVRHVTPVEARAAVLAAMGIWPFTAESFAIGDIRELYRELDGLAWLQEIVLGRRA